MKINILVKLNSKERSLKKVDEENYIAYLRAKPVNNIANIELIEIMAKYFDIPKTRISITKGIRSRKKIVDVPI